MRSVKAKLNVIGNFRVELDGQAVSYILKTSRVARCGRLEVRPGTGLTVVIPDFMPASEAKSIVEGKKRWVLAKLKQFEKRRKAADSSDSSIRYLGRKLTIVKRSDLSSKSNIALIGNRLVLRTLPGEDGMELVEPWMRQSAGAFIKQLVELHSHRTGIKFSRVRISSARTRWGSCSKNGTLSFNWKLISARPSAIEYVVIHELCHVKELNHSHAFWRLVEAYCPDWQTQRRWLRANEAMLTC